VRVRESAEQAGQTAPVHVVHNEFSVSNPHAASRQSRVTANVVPMTSTACTHAPARILVQAVARVKDRAARGIRGDRRPR
jgi:hypothetical protein